MVEREEVVEKEEAILVVAEEKEAQAEVVEVKAIPEAGNSEKGINDACYKQAFFFNSNVKLA